ncbi:phosphate ABC transporter permease PstA [Actinospica durhamensis]|uniref:Phosphate transport system permease protein PstA n=1 Tax=Actinospica durhamensis TaxID=1508375 RepID=A0A941EUR1_9ACTN|nr:phosphate ABC transporter permease PstA [Actinospica durhamensis]MBR7837646.1 phosphate ABC transporter permease PstA [Actinospica durhamensis]
MSLTHTSPTRKLKDKSAYIIAGAAFVIAIIPLISILWTVIVKGAKDFDTYFLFHSMRNVAESDSFGGAYHAILGTLEQVGIAALITIPLSLMVGIYLVEYGRGRLSQAVTFFVDVMMGLPSIVAGLFILSVWILGAGFQASGFAASLALTILMLPVAVRSTEEMLKLVSPALREASYALGVPKWRTITKVVLPTALPGIVTGMMLGIARIMGETAPVLLLVGVTQSINGNPFSEPQGSLPLFVFNESQNSLQTAVDRGWAAALTLIILIMLLNLIARLIAWWKAPAASR